MTPLFAARFPGWCGSCGEAVREGQLVYYAAGDLLHADCASCAPVKWSAVICPTCHLTQPCGCEDPS